VTRGPADVGIGPVDRRQAQCKDTLSVALKPTRARAATTVLWPAHCAMKYMAEASVRTVRPTPANLQVRNSLYSHPIAPLITQVMDTKLAPTAVPIEEDVAAAAIERLIGLFTSGQVESATLRVTSATAASRSSCSAKQPRLTAHRC
jgi:hypothetical protein